MKMMSLKHGREFSIKERYTEFLRYTVLWKEQVIRLLIPLSTSLFGGFLAEVSL